jgi:hypothetical protein
MCLVAVMMFFNLLRAFLVLSSNPRTLNSLSEQLTYIILPEQAMLIIEAGKHK